MSDVFVKVINSDLYKTRDANFQQIPSAIITQGVQKDYQNELAVTTNQVASGRAFVTMKRTTLTPNEEFLTVVELPEDTIIDTSGDGYIVIKFDETKINDSTLVDSTASNVATIEKVTSLPSDNYILLASLASGVITDERVWAELDENIIPQSYFYDEDAESDDAYAITIRGFKGYVDGMQLAFKANTANTGACTLNVNSEGAKDIKKNFSLDLIDNDIRENQIVVVRYNSTTDDFEMISPVGNATSIPAFATDSDMETATSETTISAPAKVKHAIDYFSTDAVAEAVEALSKGDPVKIVENGGSAFCHKAKHGPTGEQFTWTSGTRGTGEMIAVRVNSEITMFLHYTQGDYNASVKIDVVKNVNGKITTNSSAIAHSANWDDDISFTRAMVDVNSSGTVFLVNYGSAYAIDVNTSTLAVAITNFTVSDLNSDDGGGLCCYDDDTILVIGRSVSSSNTKLWELNWTGSAFSINTTDEASTFYKIVGVTKTRVHGTSGSTIYTATISGSGPFYLGNFSSSGYTGSGSIFRYNDTFYWIESSNLINYGTTILSGGDIDQVEFDEVNSLLYVRRSTGINQLYDWNSADPQLIMELDTSAFSILGAVARPLLGDLVGYFIDMITNPNIDVCRHFDLVGHSGVCDENTSEGSNATIKQFRKISGFTGKKAGEKIYAKNDGTFGEGLYPLGYVKQPLGEFISATELKAL